MNNTPKEILSGLEKAKNIALTLHKAPDGDSLGSCVAMKYLLEEKGKEVTLVSPDELSAVLAQHPYAKEVEIGKDLQEVEADLYLCLDSGHTKTLSNKEWNPQAKVINIDHHETNPFYGNLNYVLPHLPSCCSVIVELCKEWNVAIDAELATRLLLGICTDTHFFTTRQYNEKALEQASFLISKGARYTEDILLPLINLPQKIKQYHAEILSKLTINKEKRAAYSIIKQSTLQELNLNHSDIRLGIEVIMNIKDVDVTFMLVEREHDIKGSFRSTTKDVSLLAQQLGGGGHKGAAAFILNCSLEEAKEKVLAVLPAN